MHLEMRVLAEAIKGDECTARAMHLKSSALLGTTVTALLPTRDNAGGKFLLGGPSAQWLPQIDPLTGIEA